MVTNVNQGMNQMLFHSNLVDPTDVRQKLAEEVIPYIYPYAMAIDTSKDECAEAIETLNKMIEGESVNYYAWLKATTIADKAIKYQRRIKS